MSYACMEIEKMIIYVNTEDMRSYALTQNVTWETIAVEVDDDFVGGGKRYDLDAQTWIDDVIEPATQQEIDAQKSAENIAFLSSESERTEDEIKIYERMRDRNRADSDDLAMLEALEDYSIDLKKVTKQKGWPLEVDWPVAPEF